MCAQLAEQALTAGSLLLSILHGAQQYDLSAQARAAQNGMPAQKAVPAEGNASSRLQLQPEPLDADHASRQAQFHFLAREELLQLQISM